MDGKSILKDALGVVRPRLKAQGFAAKGTSFYRTTKERNTVVISVQKSVKSSSAESSVTINYGVYSAHVGSRLGDAPMSSIDAANAHWRKRLNHEGRERWLAVKATDSAEDAATMILGAIDGVLSELNELSTDEQLRNVWLTGSSPGIGAMQRLLFLAILLKELGPADKLPAILAELESWYQGACTPDWSKRSSPWLACSRRCRGAHHPVMPSTSPLRK